MLNLIRRSAPVTLLCLALAAAPSATLEAQQPAAMPISRITVDPGSLALEVGQTVPVKLTAYDSAGHEIANPALRISAPRGALRLTQTTVTGLTAGDFEIVVTAVAAAGSTPVVVTIPARVNWPGLDRLTLEADSGALYTGVTLAFVAHGFHADGTERPARALPVEWRSSHPAVASVDKFGNVAANRAGTVTITAVSAGKQVQRREVVTLSPVRSLTIDLDQTSLRTGEVVHLKATARRAGGVPVKNVPVTWSYSYSPDDTVAAPGATGVIDRGLFAAEVPGRYTLLAEAAGITARQVVEVKPRDSRRRISVTGRGSITHVHTSDFWPWTGKDGRDYALVGTWGGDGWAYIMDITDLGNMVRSDSVKVDARVVNDVTVSPDGRYGVLSREGASNRVNGVVILDLANPAHPKVAATFDEQLTGGVHNMFATDDYLFAISGGDRYIIIDLRDIYHPKYVSEYDHPNSRVHDVWVRDGIAYSSEWGTGVVAVDVGNGKYGGTIEKPVLINTFPTTSGATHEIYPYVQKNTGKVYLFLGDEIMSREGKVWEGTNYLQNINAKGGPPQTSAGYTHIIDFTDPKHPKDIARYHQEEFGSHDIIVEDDVMYQAYYDGGLRVVDVSGELVGNLADQRREIAVYKPFDPQGYTANASFVMNAMPWKGHIVFTDFNSGLWSAKLEPKSGMTP